MKKAAIHESQDIFPFPAHLLAEISWRFRENDICSRNYKTHNVMMQLVCSSGTVLLEREKPRTKRAEGKTTFQFRTSSEGGVEL